MPPSRSKSNRITCLVEENLPNFILVSYKDGSRVYRGVLIDERCSKVKRVIPSSLYPVRKKLKTQRQLFKSKQQQQTTKPRCQSLRSHIPEPNCIILDDVDFIETGKSPIDSIKGLVERIDKDLNIQHGSLSTTTRLPETESKSAIEKNPNLNNPADGKASSHKSNRRAIIKPKNSKTSKIIESGTASTVSRRIPSTTNSIQDTATTCNLQTKSGTNSLTGYHSTPIIPQNTSDNAFTKDNTKQKIDMNENKFAEQHSLAILKELKSLRTIAKKPSLFDKSPTKSLRDMLNAKRISSALETSSSNSKVHNTRFKGLKTVITKHEDDEDQPNQTKEVSPKTKDDMFLICAENMEEDVSLVESPVEKKEMVCFCPNDVNQSEKTELKGSRKRKASSVSLDEGVTGDFNSPSTSSADINIKTEVNTTNSTQHADTACNNQPSTKKSKRKSYVAAMRDKELINFTSQKSKSTCLYAKDNSLSGDTSRSKTKIPLFAIGDVVWGKIHGHPWWPGKVVSICINETLSNDRERQYKITWFGCESQATNTMKAVDLLPFSSEFKSKLKPRKYGSYRIAVKEAVLACKLKD